MSLMSVYKHQMQEYVQKKHNMTKEGLAQEC